MENPLVSIIVPVYNAAPYLHRCLDSIQSQDYANIEVILVNDGSEDDSLSICLEYQQKDARFKVIDKPGTGVSDTRNQGISRATGKYLQFVDSDDWITEHATGTMVIAAENTLSDMVITHFYRVIGKRISWQGHIREEEVMSRQKYAEYMLKAPANFYYGVMWNKLFRRDIIETHGLGCMEGLNWCEDFLFNLEYLQYADRICAIPVPTYYYIKTKNSLLATEATFKQTIKMKFLILDYYKELYKNVELYNENKFKIQKYIISFARDTGAFSYRAKQSPSRKKQNSKVNI